MKRIVGFVIAMIISSFIGAGLMYYGLQYFSTSEEGGTTEVINKVQRNVTVTDTGISEGIENIYNAVVVVENYQNNKLAGIGSGFIYDENGYIMTNHHVIEKSSEIKVILMSGETLTATKVGSDEYADIAVIKIDKKYVKQVAKIGDSEKIKVGDTVFTIGSPMSSDYSGTVTRGILSGKDRMVEVSVTSNAIGFVPFTSGSFKSFT